jgi:hypothetical protein
MPRFQSKFLDPPPREFVVAYLSRMLHKQDAQREKEARLERLFEPPKEPLPPQPAKAKRYHGTVALDPARVGRDAGRIADEVITHLVGPVGSSVRVTLEIEAEIPDGAPDHVVRTVTENSRTLKFESQGFESE